MAYITKESIRYDKNMDKAQLKVLSNNLLIEDVIIAKGAKYKAFETANFGYIIFHPDTITIKGTKITKLIYKW